MNLRSKIIESRARLIKDLHLPRMKEEEGGCGVTGLACSIPIKGRHIIEPSIQMHNRGNGKGGGIATLGLLPESLGVSRDLLENDYILQVAFIDPEIRKTVEDECITPYLKVDSAGQIPRIKDFRDIKGLEVRPPDVWRYFVRVKEEAIDRFIAEGSLFGLDRRKAEDEFIYQNIYRLNRRRRL